MKTHRYTRLKYRKVPNPKQAESTTFIQLENGNGTNPITNYQPIDWLIVAESVPGKSHTGFGIPCQDSHFNKVLSSGWGMSVICDGAGSAVNSNVGAAFIAKEAIPGVFGELLIQKGWLTNDTLPAPEEWELEARRGLEQVNNKLLAYADTQKMDVHSLACTAIIIIYSPFGLLVSHIGDGRAGYCDQFGDWHSLITPHKGEEANHTIFITSSAWIVNPKFSMSGVSVPECRVIPSRPTAFALLSDGCEHHSFECSQLETDGRWIDPNRPYPRFFNPIVRTLREVVLTKKPLLDLQESWKNFLESGTTGLTNEPDDKTMIIGISL